MKSASATHNADPINVLPNAALTLCTSATNCRMYSRGGVGGEYAEAAPGAEGSSYTLRFAGYSRPEQARGLDRSGYVEEIIREENSSAAAARYFGLMTSSNGRPRSRRARRSRRTGRISHFRRFKARRCRGRVRAR